MTNSKQKQTDSLSSIIVITLLPHFGRLGVVLVELIYVSHEYSALAVPHLYTLCPTYSWHHVGTIPSLGKLARAYYLLVREPYLGGIPFLIS